MHFLSKLIWLIYFALNIVPQKSLVTPVSLRSFGDDGIIHSKGEIPCMNKRYTISRKIYIIHTLTSEWSVINFFSQNEGYQEAKVIAVNQSVLLLSDSCCPVPDVIYKLLIFQNMWMM